MSESPEQSHKTIEAVAAHFESLAHTLPVEWALHELQSICDRVTFNPDIRKAFENAANDKEQTSQVLHLVADDISVPLQEFLGYLLQENKIGVLSESEGLLAAVRERMEGKLEVILTAAIDVDPEVRQRMEAKISERLGQPVRLLARKDVTIGTGCTLETDKEKFDFSMRGNLYPHIRTYLMNRISTS
ncbi:MAG: hypothetical protein K0S20_393 [Patescibacteria group bacterium]|jgi:F0F1-type ATP synthase delta subunit|nr:hypothetical protein [Patescibacteria group bacterium]